MVLSYEVVPNTILFYEVVSNPVLFYEVVPNDESSIRLVQLRSSSILKTILYFSIITMALTITKELTSNGVSLSSVFVTLAVRGTELDWFIKVKAKYFVSKEAALANSDWALKWVEGLPVDFKFDYVRANDGVDAQAFANTKVKEYLVANTDLLDDDIVVSEV